MSIISILSLKGGVGKTTTAIHLAACAARGVKSVVLFDLDPEQSAVSWAAQAESNGDRLGFAVTNLKPLDLKPRTKNHVNILDTPPNRRDVVLKTAKMSDLVIIPIAPTGLDVDRLRNTLEQLATLDTLNVAILLTKFNGRRSLARDVLEALAEYPVFDSRIRNLAKYEQAFATNPKYLDEYMSVWNEVKEMLK